MSLINIKYLLFIKVVTQKSYSSYAQVVLIRYKIYFWHL
jgi:hypothetical protein